MTLQEECLSRGFQNPDLWTSSIKDFRNPAMNSFGADLDVHVDVHILRARYSEAALMTPRPATEFLWRGLGIYPDFLPVAEAHDAGYLLGSYPASLAKCKDTMVAFDFPGVQRIKNHVAYLLGIEDSDEFEQQFGDNTYHQVAKDDNLRDDAGHLDVQTDLHIDTFFHATKFWYFPYDVAREDCPFLYVTGSHLLDARKEAFMRREYTKIFLGTQTCPYSIEGSLRLGKEECEETYGTPREITCLANTLVVGDVFGFHARSLAICGSWRRHSLHGSIRPRHPFQTMK